MTLPRLSVEVCSPGFTVKTLLLSRATGSVSSGNMENIETASKELQNVTAQKKK